MQAMNSFSALEDQVRKQIDSGKIDGVARFAIRSVTGLLSESDFSAALEKLAGFASMIAATNADHIAIQNELIQIKLHSARIAYLFLHSPDEVISHWQEVGNFDHCRIEAYAHMIRLKGVSGAQRLFSEFDPVNEPNLADHRSSWNKLVEALILEENREYSNAQLKYDQVACEAAILEEPYLELFALNMSARRASVDGNFAMAQRHLDAAVNIAARTGLVGLYRRQLLDLIDFMLLDLRGVDALNRLDQELRRLGNPNGRSEQFLEMNAFLTRCLCDSGKVDEAAVLAKAITKSILQIAPENFTSETRITLCIVVDVLADADCLDELQHLKKIVEREAARESDQGIADELALASIIASLSLEPHSPLPAAAASHFVNEDVEPLVAARASRWIARAATRHGWTKEANSLVGMLLGKAHASDASKAHKLELAEARFLFGASQTEVINGSELQQISRRWHNAGRTCDEFKLLYACLHHADTRMNQADRTRCLTSLVKSAKNINMSWARDSALTFALQALDPKHAKLAQHRLVRTLDPTIKSRLLMSTKLHGVKASERISQHMSARHEIIFVMDGYVGEFDDNAEGETLQSLLGPGDVLLTSSTPAVSSNATKRTVALGNCIIAVLPGHLASEIIADHPEFALCIAEWEKQKICNDSELRASTKLEVSERVNELLRHLDLRFGSQSMGGGRVIRTPLNQQQLADLISVSRKSLTISLNTMRTNGSLDYKRGSINLHDTSLMA